MKICWELKKTLTRILVASADFTMFIGLPLQTVSADTIEWRMNSVWVPRRLAAKAMDLFASRINEKAKGRLNVTVYHGGSLGLKDVDVLRLLPAGCIMIVSVKWAPIKAVGSLCSTFPLVPRYRRWARASFSSF